jgi:ATP-dependent DNA helicase RecG
MLKLTDPVENIKGVGDKIGAKLRYLGINQIKDLLFIFPKSYLNLESLKSIDQIQPDVPTLRSGSRQQAQKKNVGKKQIISGKISHLHLFRTRYRRMTILEGIISDKTGSLRFRYFNQPYLLQTLEDQKVYFFGKIKLDRGNLVIENPVYEFADSNFIKNQIFLPIYPEFAGLSGKKIRFIIHNLLSLAKNLTEPFDKKIKTKYELLDLKQAISYLHQPKNLEQIGAAKKTWAILELLSFIGQSKLIKEKQKNYQSIDLKPLALNSYIKNLPFKLTSDQKKSLKELLDYFSTASSKSVLLNGDVGSGKTIVAFLAAINAMLNQAQVVLMAPTEILAHQHFEVFQKFFSQFQFKTVLITNSHKIKNNNIKFKIGKISKVIENSQFIFGTHALLQERVKFKKLGLVIIDEQQRFGVKQRALLRRKSGDKNLLPHLLLLTATPIPRTLALMMMQDLKVLFLKETPFKRHVETAVTTEKQRSKIYNAILKKLKNREQVFVVCPIIEGKDQLDFDNRKAAEVEFKKIQITFKNYKVGLLHGRMKPLDKEKAISNFRKGKTRILVSTSVVEVGVDIPKATVLLVETAERFGLSQLHQLRGRIGRAGDTALAFFMTNSRESAQKLKILRETNDGFKVAMSDLQQRGPGQILGQSQHGLLNFRFANLFDERIIKIVKDIIKNDPKLSTKIYKNIFR